jgi:hypothetical protein
MRPAYSSAPLHPLLTRGTPRRWLARLWVAVLLGAWLPACTSSSSLTFGPDDVLDGADFERAERKDGTPPTETADVPERPDVTRIDGPAVVAPGESVTLLVYTDVPDASAIDRAIVTTPGASSYLVVDVLGQFQPTPADVAASTGDTFSVALTGRLVPSDTPLLGGDVSFAISLSDRDGRVGRARTFTARVDEAGSSTSSSTTTGSTTSSSTTADPSTSTTSSTTADPSTSTTSSTTADPSTSTTSTTSDTDDPTEGVEPCLADQQVLANARVPCPPGTTNAAGDDPSGPDTSCDPIFCDANERVVANACVACPPNTTNEPGDDASGPDTSCVDVCEAMLGTACDAYLKASNTSSGDNFGASVAASGDTIAIGAFLEDSNATGVNGNQANASASNSGAVYVFRRTGTVWAQEAYLKPSNTGSNDYFGVSVALDGDTLVVGAEREDSGATGVDGDGANNGALDSGAAYVFTRSGSTWSQQAYLKASNTGGDDRFGYAVTVSGDTIAVGAYGEASGAPGINGDQASNTSSSAGAVYVFVRSGTTWTQEAYVKASNPEANAQFGFAVTLDGDTLAVGARGENSSSSGVNGMQGGPTLSNSGAVYVFRREGSTWAQEAFIKASNSAPGAQFGYSVALSGDALAVGAYAEASSATGVNGNQADVSMIGAGAAYVFRRTGTVWTQEAYIKASNTAADDFFGFALALAGDVLVVGAEREDSNAIGVDGDQSNDSATQSGAAYVFRRTGTTWAQEAYVKASNTGASDRFGTSVALAGATLVIGAPVEGSSATGVNGDQADNAAFGAGAAYVRRVAP